MRYIDTTSMEVSKTEEEGISLLEQLLFFVPLGATSLLISVTHSLFNAAIARLPNPELYGSAFQVGKSLMQVVQNPVAMIKQMMAALIKDKESYYKVRNFTIILVTSVLLFFTILVFSGGAEWIFKNLMGVKEDVLKHALTVVKILIIFPAAVSLRNFMQGVAIKFRRTPLVTIATIARVTFVSIIILFISKITFIPPSIIPSFMFLGAVFVEAITVTIGVKLSIKDIPTSIEGLNTRKVNMNVREINYRLIIGFFAPLVITSFIRALAKPIIDSGLARTIDSKTAIFTYGVAWGLGVIVVSPLMMFHQVPLNFIEGNNKEQINSVKKFAIILGIFLSSILGLMAFSPIGTIILTNIIGVSDKIALLSVDVLKVMTILPMAMVIRQFYWGMLMKEHKTSYISIGKIINLVMLFIAIFIANLFNPANAALVGIIGKVSSEAFESLYLYIINRKVKE